MIRSVRNPKVQELRALQRLPKRRREKGAFVVEGSRLAEEALMSGWQVREAIYTEGASEASPELVRALVARGHADLVSEAVMKAASDTQTPQGVLVEVEWRQLPLVSHPSLVLILDGISDPGNLGTLLRSAAAADCDAVLLAPGCADAFAPKVLRSGMGAHFRQPIQTLEWPNISRFLKEHKLALYLAQSWEGQPFDKADLTQPFALIVGSEASGVSEAAKALDPQPIQIPMPGRMESLNAAIAGSILLFEAVRQRNKKSA
ncbi:MAG: RNA methyltransferase [Chloroflexi bacterium]|nr:RNA methyltransferase [Chloroflexota bacterium]